MKPFNSPPRKERLALTGEGQSLVEDVVVVGREDIEIDRGGWLLVSHRRRIPRMLVKNPKRNVWNPTAVRVTPGMTQRMVRA